MWKLLINESNSNFWDNLYEYLLISHYVYAVNRSITLYHKRGAWPGKHALFNCLRLFYFWHLIKWRLPKFNFTPLAKLLVTFSFRYSMIHHNFLYRLWAWVKVEFVTWNEKRSSRIPLKNWLRNESKCWLIRQGTTLIFNIPLVLVLGPCNLFIVCSKLLYKCFYILFLLLNIILLKRVINEKTISFNWLSQLALTIPFEIPCRLFAGRFITQ